MQVNRREAIGIGLAGTAMTTLAGAAQAAVGAPAAPGLTRLRVCELDQPLALGDLPPRFSWQLAQPGARAQTAYRVTVAASESDLAAGRLLWDSGRVASSATVDIPYGGPALPSRARAVWQVTSWTGTGAPVISAPAAWETGLAPGDWQAEWLASETTVARADRMAGLHWITGAAPLKVGQPRAYRWTVTEAVAGPAEFCLSANETLEVWHNGVRLPFPSEVPQDGPMRWTQMAVFPVTLAKGRNVFGVLVKRNAGFGVAPPTLAAILRRGPGLAERLSSGDAGWTTAVEPAAGWAAPDFVDAAWEPATAATGALPIGQPWPVYPANLLRRSFTASRPVRAARLHVTALGVYEPMLNGRKVGDRKLAPEFTDPSKRVLFQTYDVTDRVAAGANTLGFEVADGWYGGKFSSAGRFAFGPAPLRLLAQLELDYADGTREIVATGKGWEIAESAVRAAGNYDGEIYDARLERAGWATPADRSPGWRAAETIEAPAIAVEPQRCPPIRVTRVLQPAASRRLGPGRHVVDFGQNFAGWARLTVTAPAGTRIVMRFAELVGADGGVDQSNLRTAWARDVYTAAGRGEEVWEPRFTYHGFRYVEITGVPDGAWRIEGLVGHQDLELTGELRVGEPVIQKFWENSVWSQRSNFYGLPTDCPQRDERLGWMGDAEVFWPAAAWNMDVGAYTARVMEDMRHGQTAKGAFPDCIPPFVPGSNLSSPGWADAGVVLPFTAWQRSGDSGIIAASWDAMERYLGWIAAANPDHLWKKGRGADYGDWLAVDAPTSNPGAPTTPKDLVGTAFWAGDAQMMAQMAQALGKSEAAQRYRDLFASIRTAFQAAYVKPDGTVGNDSQTGHVLAIRFGLLDPAQVAESGRRLVADIARRGGHLSTGFLGTPHILDALAMAGHEDAAMALLLQRSFPSWGYMVEKGATTMWERWNSDAGDTGMNSRNHYAFGAIGDFLFRRVAGIAPLDPGFARVRVAPIMDPRLGSGGATYRSVRGPIRTDWTAKAGAFRLDVELPAGVTGEVALPGGRKAVAKAGLNRFSGRLA